ncbi:hypothetical protein Q7689_17635, partial [Nocardiopsis tropica]|nr:hypothetical protein [Nocardiopsis tropica]
MASPTATAEPPPPRVGNEPAARQHTAHDRRNMSAGPPDAPQSASGAGDVASETQAALSSVTRFAAWVLDYLVRIFQALLQAVLGLAMAVLRPVAGLVAAFVRWRVRRGRIPIRTRVAARRARAVLARISAGRALEGARRRAEAYVANARARGEGMVQAAEQARDRTVDRAGARAAAELGAARDRRNARVTGARQRVDRVTARVRASADADVERAKGRRRELVDAASGRGAVAERDAGRRGDALVRA